MSTTRLKALRINVIATLVLLVIQFEFGIAVNLSPNLPELPAFGFSPVRLAAALSDAGVVAWIHAILGSLLAIGSIVTLIRSLASRIRSVQIVGTLGFLTMLLAAVSGLLFVLSGFQNDNYSHGMATNFILTFALFFLELYFLKPAPKVQRD